MVRSTALPGAVMVSLLSILVLLGGNALCYAESNTTPLDTEPKWDLRDAEWAVGFTRQWWNIPLNQGAEERGRETKAGGHGGAKVVPRTGEVPSKEAEEDAGKVVRYERRSMAVVEGQSGAVAARPSRATADESRRPEHRKIGGSTMGGSAGSTGAGRAGNTPERHNDGGAEVPGGGACDAEVPRGEVGGAQGGIGREDWGREESGRTKKSEGSARRTVVEDREGGGVREVMDKKVGLVGRGKPLRGGSPRKLHHRRLQQAQGASPVESVTLSPSAIALGGLAVSSDTLYVADTGGHQILALPLRSFYQATVAPGTVWVLAGQRGVAGRVDGNSSSAVLYRPYSVVLSYGRLFFTEGIPDLDSAPLAVTLAPIMATSNTSLGGGGRGGSAPLWSAVRVVDNRGGVTTVYEDTVHIITALGGHTMDSDLLWVGTRPRTPGNGTTGIQLLSISKKKYVASYGGATSKTLDGPASAALFDVPTSLAVAPRGTGVYVATGTDGGRIRFFNLTTNEVITVAGNGVSSSRMGPGDVARFIYPTNLTISADGAFLYTWDAGASILARIYTKPNPRMNNAAVNVERIALPDVGFPTGLAVDPSTSIRLYEATTREYVQVVQASQPVQYGASTTVDHESPYYTGSTSVGVPPPPPPTSAHGSTAHGLFAMLIVVALVVPLVICACLVGIIWRKRTRAS